MTWVRYWAEALDDEKIQSLPAALFKKKFLAAVAGEENEFAPYIQLEPGWYAGTDWKTRRTAVFERDDYTCQYCGARGVQLQCDHIIPFSRGGPHDLGNLTTACKPCNQSKRAKTPEEWHRDVG